MSELVEREHQYYMQVARRQPVVIVKGEGSWVWDEAGEEYLDFHAGWAVDTLGHCPPVLVDAIRQQAGLLFQTSNQFYTLPQIELAELLVENSCLDRVFLCNSGAEANEGAFKLARKYGRLHRNGAYEIISTENAFHGRTITTAAAGGNPQYSATFAPLTPGFSHVPWNDIEALKSATNAKTCAIVLEPVQGEAGVNCPSPSYLGEVRQWCDEQGILLILDEVQTGIGRLGALFGYQLFDVEPDVLTLAKGLGGGVPIGAFLCKEQYQVLEPGDHGSTFGGNPLACAGAYAVVKHVIENNISGYAGELGEYLAAGLLKIQARHETVIKEVRGMGLMRAVEFHEAIGPDVVGGCNEERLLVNPVRPNSIRFTPPLNVSRSEVDIALERFERGLERVTQE